MKKKVVAMMMAAVMACSLMACGSTNDAADTTANETEATDATDATEATDTAEATDATDAATDGKQYTIGISQFAEHGSLDNCREGFLQGLADAGIVEGENLTVIYDNAQADTGTASTIAENYVSQGVDMICGIATPSAMAAYNSCMNTDIPVIYTAVSDPVEAGLAKEDGTPAGNITGTSDALAINAQLEMIREILPDAKTIGIIYTTSETNSVSTIESYKEAAPDYGFEIVETGINVVADVEMAAKDLAGKVDCITNLTDNTVVSALQTELAAAKDAGIPVFGSEVEQVKAGCVASMGLEYVELGKQTGAMAAKVLKGEAKASEMNFEVISEPSLYINTKAAADVNLTISDDMMGKAYQTFDEITVE